MDTIRSIDKKVVDEKIHELVRRTVYHSHLKDQIVSKMWVNIPNVGLGVNRIIELVILTDIFSNNRQWAYTAQSIDFSFENELNYILNSANMIKEPILGFDTDAERFDIIGHNEVIINRSRVSAPFIDNCDGTNFINLVAKDMDKK